MSLLPPPPPPPPPPAPPPPPISPSPTALFLKSSDKSQAGGVVMDSVDVMHYMAVGQMGMYRCLEVSEGEGKKDNNSKTVFLSYYRTVVPIIQKGPLCGLVAVAMAVPLMQSGDIMTERLLEMAIEKGYTKQGEMFSATSMSDLVQSLLKDPIKSEVVTGCEESQILQFLLHGDLLLIPYDADKNHSPCQRKGHKAHWMLITGCCLAVDNSSNIIDLTLLEEHEDYYERNLFHLKPANRTTPELLKILQQKTDNIVGVIVYGHQGKSKHTGAWTISELLTSNGQLLELGPERDAVSYVVPSDGIEEGLCRQIVRIFQSDQT